MIEYQKHILSNGLTLLLHEDHDTPLVTVNTFYRVGARNESPDRTGFAHLFEHLMFGGTPRVPDYDAVVSNMGGECNASTNNDYTNYYVTAPAEHLPTMLRIEADRMAGLDFSEHSLAVQQRVVTEEYNQRYLNQPYGDKWLHLRPLCYKVHPYRWCTIGADIRHVQQATVDDERQFFARHYYPANAIVSVAGHINTDRAVQMVEHLFGDLSSQQGGSNVALPQEPEPVEPHRLQLSREVPSDALFMAFLMCDRLHPDFVVYDIISDVLSNGHSSRMYNRLVKEQGLFSELNVYLTGDRDRGLFVIDGKVQPGKTLEAAEAAVWKELSFLCDNPISSYELQKVVNKFESTFAFSQYKVADRAHNLCYFEWLGHLNWVNDEPLLYRRVTPDDVQRVARRCFQPYRANVIYYKSVSA
ncbi:MAG: insulinase family protein [Bacteroidales bacterium]|nr:insulinase family protein [Bacteroidales bacterium]